MSRSAAETTDLIGCHHARVVEPYRRAHAIARQDGRGQTSTEELRQATMAYRALLEDLLGERLAERDTRAERAA